MRIQTINRREHGFSLLELVVAVSIMLILGVVGFVAYQSYTDNARQAALDTSANQVLTAVIAADNAPDGDAPGTVERFNTTSQDITVDIVHADDRSMTVQAMTCDGETGLATVPGQHGHVPTTSFNDVQYSWITENGHPVSVKRLCGEVVAKNHARNPRAADGTGWIENIRGVWDTSVVSVDDHPLGIETAIESVFADYNYADEARDSLSLYNVGNLPVGQEEVYFGVWVKTDTPGKVRFKSGIDPIEIPVNEWVFVTTGNQRVSISERHESVVVGLQIRHDKDLYQEATSWATGAVLSYDAPVTDFFDGDM